MTADDVGVLRRVRQVADLLATAPRCSTSEVASLVGVSKASAQRYLSFLARLDIVVGRRDPKHRQRRVWRLV